MSLEATHYYEYVISSIKAFIVRESAIAAATKSSLVDGESFIGQMFSMDFSLLRFDKVRDDLRIKFTALDSSTPRLHEAALARTNAEYVQLCAAVGVEKIDEIRDRVIKGLVLTMPVSYRSTDSDQNMLISKITALFVSCPCLIIFVLGTQLFQESIILGSSFRRSIAGV